MFLVAHLVIKPALTTLLSANGDWGLILRRAGAPGELDKRGNAGSPSWYSNFQLTDSDF